MRQPRQSAADVTRAAVLFCITVLLQSAVASENVPHRPFALWADVPSSGQIILGAVYEQAAADEMWAGGVHHRITSNENDGIYNNQGFLALQYGITEKLAADLNIGVTTISWRFVNNAPGESTTGLMDVGFGLRYQLFKEGAGNSDWIPTLTFRLGAVLPGSYNQNFPFSPGLHSSGMEPELLVRKHFAWAGFGAYGDGLYRFNLTTHNDQYILAAGLFQQIGGWELDLGWRHLQTLSGSDIVFNPDNSVVYPRDVRENSDALEAGASYTTSRRHFRYGLQFRVVMDGNNTDDKFWFGLSVDFPFGGKSPSSENAAK